MKSLAALTIAVLLLLMGGSLLTQTINKREYKNCVGGDYANEYRNSWDDVYFFWQLPYYSGDSEVQLSLECAGPAHYVRYHPYDAAALVLICAGVAGYIAFNDKPKGKKKS